ncbi:receptor-like protein EIX2 [Cynara cardunculus var. scolymus]|uniref:receptor-like protein EIX2 n=1 Tax=Cynara cardunculus var. scolymus TaxID=59895 RepID=UPI000D62CF1B|nr:receptor-like protein EIX2 [Cynara cardunculus var. scolymus]
MIWFYFVLISMLLLCPNTTILATCSSIGNQSAAATDGNYGGINKSCFHKEKQALLHFKASLRDPLGQLSTWRPAEDDDCCKWSGVTCNNHTGHVTELNLHSYHLRGEISPSLLNLTYLNHLDLCFNSFDGTIPKVITSMTQLRLLQYNIHSYGGNMSFIGTYVDNAMVEWQGNEQEFTNNLGLLTSIDLSSNNLTGKFPNELVDLHQLLVLNLSKNALFGEIPRKIGEMMKLITLDLSRNNFLGEIPSSMSNMTLLSYLDVSYNKLSGRIPSSTQLQSFEPSRYTGNVGLCGPPLAKSCRGDEVPHIVGERKSGEEGVDELQRWFYIGGCTGFATGFWMSWETCIFSLC